MKGSRSNNTVVENISVFTGRPNVNIDRGCLAGD